MAVRPRDGRSPGRGAVGGHSVGNRVPLPGESPTEATPTGVRSPPAGQGVRYLLVGGWNTAFGYGCYALLTYLFTGLVPCAYMAAAVLNTVVNITVAYLGYKIFVFKTKGNYVREYLRCYLVYGTTILLNLALLPVLVAALDPLIRPQVYVPYIAGAILTAGSVVLSFLGHKRYTFSAP